MTNQKLTSNFSGNTLQGVGKAVLKNGTISITAEAGSSVVLLRGANKVVLLRASDKQLTTSGSVVLGDVYTLEKGEERLIIKVENEEIKHETNLYINNDPTFDATLAKRKTTLTTGVLILFVLVISVIFGIQQKKIREFNTKSEEQLNIAISNYENLSRESFVSAKEIANKLKEDGYKSEKLDKLLLDILTNESEILGEIKPELKELLDLTLQINGFDGSKLVSTGENIFVLDKNNKNVVQTNIVGKDTKIVANKDDLDGVIEIASYEDRLFYINNEAIFEINNNREKIKDSSWGNSLFYLYSGNIYLIDITANQIFRFVGNNKSFGDKNEWLAPGIEADFSKVIDMTIDGSIWALSSSGKVTKFTNGNPNSILMDGIIDPLENPTAIYTNESLKYTYVLDKDNGRVVVLEKNGDFKLQYKSDEIKNAKDLVVSEEEKKIILLTGPKLMYFEPKQ